MKNVSRDVLSTIFRTRQDLGLKIGQEQIIQGDAEDLRKHGSLEDNSYSH